ncbi:MAG: hypothetical protein JNM84_09410 [Planctomycetes bacterium]|nr:hypothetical protein [Planctomycetota bacterium]
MIHRPSPSCTVSARATRVPAAWIAPLAATVVLAFALTACGGDDRPDGSFAVERSRGSRTERVEPGRAPAAAASGTSASNPGAANLGAGSPGGARASAAAAESGAGLVWKMPEAFVREAVPASFAGVYLDFCRLPKAGVETHDGIVVSSVVAGTIEANLERWKGQFAGGQVVREGAFELPASSGGALRGALLEIEGPTFAMRGSLWTEGPPSPVRAIFAVIEGPSGLLTLRYVGPPAGGERAAAPFRALIDSVRRADSASAGGGK